MTVGFAVGAVTDEIGSADFFHAFFSTIAVRLEPRWGARFPVVMTRLYRGELPAALAPAALAELRAIRAGLAAFPSRDVVWDHADRSRRPPWGDAIAGEITDLSTYFVTSAGRDLIATLEEAIAELAARGGTGRVVPC
jgi:hypothetical protein